MFNSTRKRLGAFFVALTAMLVGLPAMADDVSTAVVTAITATNPQIIAVVGAMAGALVIILSWQLIKRAFGGGK